MLTIDEPRTLPLELDWGKLEGDAEWIPSAPNVSERAGILTEQGRSGDHFLRDLLRRMRRLLLRQETSEGATRLSRALWFLTALVQEKDLNKGIRLVMEEFNGHLEEGDLAFLKHVMDFAPIEFLPVEYLLTFLTESLPIREWAVRAKFYDAVSCVLMRKRKDAKRLLLGLQ